MPEAQRHRARQHHLLDVVALADQVGHRVAVRDALHALEEQLLVDVGVLVELQDVAAVARDEVGDRRHDALLVGAGDEQHRVRVGHGEV